MPGEEQSFLQFAAEFSDPQAVWEALRQQEQARLASQTGESPPTPYRAPQTPTEVKLTEIWKELLGVATIGVDDNFFDLGGHSILATQLLSRVQEVFQINLPIETLFVHTPTIAELAKVIEQHWIQEASSEELASILQKLEGLSEVEIARLLSEDMDGT